MIVEERELEAVFWDTSSEDAPLSGWRTGHERQSVSGSGSSLPVQGLCAARSRAVMADGGVVCVGPCDAWEPAGGAGASLGGRSDVRACTRRVGAPMGEKALLASAGMRRAWSHAVGGVAARVAWPVWWGRLPGLVQQGGPLRFAWVAKHAALAGRPSAAQVCKARGVAEGG